MFSPLRTDTFKTRSRLVTRSKAPKHLGMHLMTNPTSDKCANNLLTPPFKLNISVRCFFSSSNYVCFIHSLAQCLIPRGQLLIEIRALFLQQKMTYRFFRMLQKKVQTSYLKFRKRQFYFFAKCFLFGFARLSTSWTPCLLLDCLSKESKSKRVWQNLCKFCHSHFVR